MKRMDKRADEDYNPTVAILEHLHDAIFILNAAGIIEYANKSAMELLGLNSYKLVGTSLRNYLVSDTTDSWFDEVLAGSNMEIEARLRGHEYAIPVLVSFGVIEDPARDMRFILVSARDIGWRKEMERMLNQQQIMTLSKSRYKEMGELAINLVHNLGQPLTSLQLKLDLAKKECQKETPRLEKIDNHLHKMTGLLQNIHKTVENARQFARQSEDESLKALNVESAMKKALEQLDYEFTEKNIAIIKKTPGKPTHILANPLSIQQVLVTLLRKLIQANLETQIQEERSIEIELTSENGKWTAVSIKSPSAYWQSPDDIMLTMDLKVVQLIVETIGGDFRWYNNKSNGILFQIRFPLNSGNEREQLQNLIALLHQS